jgi:hypothetical protein
MVATAESSAAAPGDVLERSGKAFSKAVAELNLQQRMGEKLEAELRAEDIAREIVVRPEVGPLSAADGRADYRQIDAPMVLETAVLEFGFLRGKTRTAHEGHQLTLTIRARLVDRANGTPLDEMQRSYRSEAHTATEWLQDDAATFMRELNALMTEYAQTVVLEFFTLYYPPQPADPMEEASNWHTVLPGYVLKPEYPELRRGLDMRGAFSDKYAGGCGTFTLVSAVDSLQPTFRWESFPRPADLAAPPNQGRRISDVSYEIVVFRTNRLGKRRIPPFVAPGDHPPCFAAGELAYTRRDLPQPEHRMEEPLQACARYAWSVRTHFRLGGHPRVGEWSGSYPANVTGTWTPSNYRRNPGKIGLPDWAPSNYLFLFRAPPPDGVQECED